MLICFQLLEVAELDEKKLFESNNLPSDPVNTSSSEINILKLSFGFLLRRLAVYPSLHSNSPLILMTMTSSQHGTVLCVIKSFKCMMPSGHTSVPLDFVYFSIIR